MISASEGISKEMHPPALRERALSVLDHQRLISTYKQILKSIDLQDLLTLSSTT
jgi:hypothetical protein